MANTVHGVIKPSKHLHLLAFKLHEPFWIVALLVFVPFVLLAVLVVRNRRSGSWRLPLSTEAMVAAVAVQLGWWLLLSPTGNSWLRRALSGILLLELMASIVLVWSAVWIWRRARAGPAREPRGWIAAVVGLAACLAVTLAAFVHHSPATLRPRSGPTTERRATEALADRVRALPANATLYAIGWYEAPVVSALTARQIHDIEAFPIDRYRTSLAHSYLVVDSHLLGNRPDAVKAVLRRSTAELLWEQWRCRLFRLDSIGPYAPIPEADAFDDLLTVYRPTEHPEYPFVGGLSEQHELRALSRAVSGVRLRWSRQSCLLLSLEPLAKAGAQPELEIRLDGTTIHRTHLAGETEWTRTISLGETSALSGGQAVVELWLESSGPQRPFALYHHDHGTFQLNAVGFTDCSTVDASTILEPQTTGNG